MSSVAIVEGGVVVYRGSLPKSWKNSSGLHNSRDDWSVLNPLGIFHFDEVFPSYDNSTEKYDGWTEDIQADKVVLTWVVRSKTADELSSEVALTAVAYIHERRHEYPEIADQLDDIYHNGIEGWKATIKVIKDKYPKPNGGM